MTLSVVERDPFHSVQRWQPYLDAFYGPSDQAPAKEEFTPKKGYSQVDSMRPSESLFYRNLTSVYAIAPSKPTVPVSPELQNEVDTFHLQARYMGPRGLDFESTGATVYITP